MRDVNGRTGLSLLELIIALGIGMVVASAAFRVLIHHARVVEGQMLQAERQATALAAATILPPEFRELSAVDSSGSDFYKAEPVGITYRAMRYLAFICRPPDTAGMAVTVRRPAHGVRDPDAAIDSALLYVSLSALPSVGGWEAVDITSGTLGALCADGSPGTRLTLSGVAPNRLRLVTQGSPLRGFEVSQIRAYPDARGWWWIGQRRWQKASRRWPRIQPMIGPIAPGGLRFRYRDRAGASTADLRAVALVEIELAVPIGGRIGRPRGLGSRQHVFAVAPRNGFR